MGNLGLGLGFQLKDARLQKLCERSAAVRLSGQDLVFLIVFMIYL